jgi:hypothetical protein
MKRCWESLLLEAEETTVSRSRSERLSAEITREWPSRVKAPLLVIHNDKDGNFVKAWGERGGHAKRLRHPSDARSMDSEGDGLH